MSTFAAVSALPAAAVTIWLLLRAPFRRRLARKPEQSRWTTTATPLVGGIGIYAGFALGLWLAVQTGPLHGNEQVLGIFAGATLLFLTGLADDLWRLRPPVKLAAQVFAAVVVVATGTRVEIVHSDVVAVALGLVWLVGMTNAFNLLDNMDGLAGSLAAIAAGFFAASTTAQGGTRLVLVLSVALACAVAGFLPFNLRPGRRARAWMGDSGSQLIGFTLAVLGLASSWTVASSTVATLLLPVLVLAVPILDTTLVTIVRLLDGRPLAQGGRDHSSHRLVALGASETGAVVLLAAISVALGGTSLAYEGFGNGRVAAVGVLVTFALLVQFGGVLADADRGIERRPLYAYLRRLVEVGVDGVLIGASFLAAYLLRFDGAGTFNQRHLFLLSLPAVLFTRYATFIAFGLYAGVWRHAGSRDAARVVTAVIVSEVAAVGFVVLTQAELGDFSRSVFVIDALICSIAITASRFAERAISGGVGVTRRSDAHRIVIVGAGRAGRSLLRELRETPSDRVVAFADDDPALVGRRLNGVRVVGGTEGFAHVLERTSPETVLVTIPNAARDRLDEIVRACAGRQVTCRFVRRELDIDPHAILHSGK